MFMVLKSNELLSLFAIIKKSSCIELVEIINCCSDDLILKKKNEFFSNPMFQQILKMDKKIEWRSENNGKS